LMHHSVSNPRGRKGSLTAQAGVQYPNFRFANENSP
jgi:hypothetical protein